MLSRISSFLLALLLACGVFQESGAAYGRGFGPETPGFRTDRLRHAEARSLRAVDECREAVAARPPTRLLLKLDHAVCFVGVFVLGTEDEIIPLLDSSRVLVIKSAGGIGVSAARLGLYLLDHGIDVAVLEYCLSACANWVFLAGRTKYVPDGAFVAWHGLPQEPDPKAKLLDHSGMLATTYGLSRALFDRISIDRALAMEPDRTVPGYESWSKKVKSDGMSYWTWSPNKLRDRFRVDGIVYYWYPHDVKILREKADKLGINLLAEPGNEGPDGENPDP